MCTSTPDMPKIAERQATKLPDEGAPLTEDSISKRRRAMIAGLVGMPKVALGSPVVAKPTLG